MDHLREYGLKVESPLGDFHLEKIHVYSDPTEMPECDVTIVFEVYAEPSLERILPSTTGDSGVVLVLQNGLDVELDVVSIVGKERVLGGLLFSFAAQSGTKVKHLDYGAIVFGEYRAEHYFIKTPPNHLLFRTRIADDLCAAD